VSILNWGSYTWVNGLTITECKSLKELARRSELDLLHVVNVLLNDGSEEAEELAEELFELHA